MTSSKKSNVVQLDSKKAKGEKVVSENLGTNRTSKAYIDPDYIKEDTKEEASSVLDGKETQELVPIPLTVSKALDNLATKTNGQQVAMVDPNAIYIDNSNIRFTLGSKENMIELENSIKEYGIKQPVLLYPLTKNDNGYDLGYKYGVTHGFRRVSVAQKIKNSDENLLSKIPALLSEKLDEEKNILLHLTLNNGVSLNMLEIGKAYLRLREIKGYTIDNIAKKVSRANSYVHNAIKLYEQSLESEIVKEALQENAIAPTEIIKLNSEFKDKEITEFIIEESKKVAEKRAKEESKKEVESKKDSAKNKKEDTVDKKPKAPKITSKDIEKVKKDNKQLLSKDSADIDKLKEDLLEDISEFINHNKHFNKLLKAKNLNFEKVYDKLNNAIKNIF